MNEYWFYYIWAVLTVAVFISNFYHINKRE